MEFTDVGEWRKGKGRKSRLAYSVPTHSDIDQQTPNGIAFRKLVNRLSRQGSSDRSYETYTIPLRDAEQLRFMNMDLLAEVISYRLSGQPFDIEYLRSH